MQCASNRNFYGAGKTILTDNPLGWSCGNICPSFELCAGACNLKNTAAGAIKIREVQEFSLRRMYVH